MDKLLWVITNPSLLEIVRIIETFPPLFYIVLGVNDLPVLLNLSGFIKHNISK
jgi:hypothetical protein